MTRGGTPRGPAVDYRTLAELRYHIRRFLRAREDAARAAGVEPQHYLLLLQIRGLEGERPATVGALAERLQLRHHTVVELVDRLAARGMVTRRRAPSDRRRVVVELRPAGHAVLKRLALYSVEDLRTEGPALVAALTRLIGHPAPARRVRPKRVGQSTCADGTDPLAHARVKQAGPAGYRVSRRPARHSRRESLTRRARRSR